VVFGTNWVAVPAPLYYILTFLSLILISLSIILFIRGIRNKKNKGYYIILGFILVVSTFIAILIFNGVLIANTMIGG
jgi:hypothetical protein